MNLPVEISNEAIIPAEVNVCCIIPLTESNDGLTESVEVTVCCVIGRKNSFSERTEPTEVNVCRII